LAFNSVTGRASSSPKFDSCGYCNHVIAEDAGNEVRFGCGVDCEGGGVTVALSKDDKSAGIRLARIVVWNRNKPDDEAGDALLAGADNKIFRLDRTEARECAELVTDRQELAACGNTMKSQHVDLKDLLPGFTSADRGGVIPPRRIAVAGLFPLAALNAVPSPS
jgi:intracellular sulfur oxidation DsrE/DsrF family protein